MNEINPYEEIDRLIARILDSLAHKGNSEEDLQMIQERHKWIIALMDLFPEMGEYRDFLTDLSKINEQGPSPEITGFVFDTVRRFFDRIFTPKIRKSID